HSVVYDRFDRAVIEDCETGAVGDAADAVVLAVNIRSGCIRGAVDDRWRNSAGLDKGAHAIREGSRTGDASGVYDSRVDVVEVDAGLPVASSLDAAGVDKASTAHEGDARRDRRDRPACGVVDIPRGVDGGGRTVAADDLAGVD